MDDYPRYSISVAAELVGMHPQTLRMYEARGLVRPRRTAGGTRRYCDRDLERLRRINQLTQELGLSLAGAVHVLGLERRIEQLTAQVGALEAELAEAARKRQDEVAATHRHYRRELILYEAPKHPTKDRRQNPWTSRN